MGGKILEGFSTITRSSQEVTSDILVMNFTIVTACLVGDPNNRTAGWALVDTGLENSADFILQAVEERFGKSSRPQAIILTHGHFDHIGSVLELSELWNVPVYAHRLELPYITGKKDYPVPDPTVDKGLVAKMSPAFPHKSIDIGSRAVALPDDGSVPGMPGWRWIHTPGHTEGHISLFREKDRVLIAGDALSTVEQESLVSVATQEEEISGPPKYFTIDWKAAKSSVKQLRDLRPLLLIPGHGQSVRGEELTENLEKLVNYFDQIAKPDQGRFVEK